MLLPPSYWLNRPSISFISSWGRVRDVGLLIPQTAERLAARALGNWEGGEKMADKSILSHEEVLELLSDRAREGSISAAIALERALRATPKSDEDWDDELSRIIADD
jgi:hypothetical protein